jgi:hypothetical protein
MNGHTEVVKTLIEVLADVEAKEKVRCRRCVGTGIGGLEQMPKILLQHVESLETN